MGWFEKKPAWESLPADEMAAMLKDLHVSGKAKEAEAMMKKIKQGKVPGITGKEQKEMAKFHKRVTEGEKGAKAAIHSLRELKKMSGAQRHKNIPLKDRVHPSEYKNQIRTGKYRPGAQEAADIKKSDPALYKKLLEQEARKQGLL